VAGKSALLRFRFLFLLAAAFACTLPACTKKDRPNVLLITLDTLRADHLGCYGRANAETPRIDALAREGVLFEKAFTPAPSTLPAHVSILTGLYPHQHGVRDNAVYYLPDEEQTLAEILAGEGYVTAAFTSAFVLNEQFGVGQGFGVFDDEMDDPIEKALDKPRDDLPEYSQWWMEQKTKPFQRIAENTVGQAAGWLRANSEKKPFFCWVHLFDPHMPYTPPEPWLEKFAAGYDGPMDGTMSAVLDSVKAGGDKIMHADVEHMIDRYDGEIAYTDHWVGRLLDVLDETGVRGKTLIIVVSDHGESFGEHLGLFFEHNASVYDETLHVPLIIVPPQGAAAAGRRSNAAVSLVDIVPTVLDIVDADAPEDLPGRALLAGEGGADRAGKETGGGDRTVYFEALCSRQAMPSSIHYRGARSADYKLFRVIENKTRGRQTWRFHCNRDDPAETQDLARAGGAEFSAMEQALLRFLKLGRVNEKSPKNFWPLQDDEERIERMRALGYIK